MTSTNNEANMNAPADRTILAIGTPYADGGLFIGNIFVGHEPFQIIRAPKAECEIALRWGKTREMVEGALSVYDGLANTRAMAEAGSELAQRMLALRLGGHDDWYLLSRGEALLAFAANELLPEVERLDRDVYWTSTQYAGAPEYAWFQHVNYGYQSYWHKSFKLRGVAVRRVPIR